MAAITSYPYVFGNLFLLIVISIGFLLVWVAERSPAAPLLKNCAGVVAPFASLPALLFGLFSAFLANDIFLHAERARSSVTREAEAVRVILSVADALEARGRGMRQMVLDLGRTSVGDDWRAEPQAAAAEARSLRLLREIMFGALASADAQVRHVAAEAVMEIRSARRDRVAVAQSTTGRLKWVAALILGILTQIAVVVVHLGKPRTAMLAVTLFSAGMAFMLWVILERHDPFSGAYPVSVAAIEEAYRQPP